MRLRYHCRRGSARALSISFYESSTLGRADARLIMFPTRRGESLTWGFVSPALFTS